MRNRWQHTSLVLSLTALIILVVGILLSKSTFSYEILLKLPTGFQTFFLLFFLIFLFFILPLFSLFGMVSSIVSIVQIIKNKEKGIVWSIVSLIISLIIFIFVAITISRINLSSFL